MKFKFLLLTISAISATKLRVSSTTTVPCPAYMSKQNDGTCGMPMCTPIEAITPAGYCQPCPPRTRA